MVMLKDFSGCSTTATYGLSQQIIDEMNVLVPGSLIDCSDLDISIGSKQFPYLQRPAKQSLARAIRAREMTMNINSAYRTIAQQFLLRQWSENHQCGISLAAIPGKSNHQSGLAIDIPDFNGWRPFLVAEGWRWLGATTSDKVHFDFVGSGRRDIKPTGIMAFQVLWNKNHLNDKIDEDGFYGPDTARRLAISPAEGFGIIVPGTPRILRLTRPLMQGGDVRRVQQALIGLGYNLGSSGADGIYGSGTVAAVKKFQQDQGIDADGIVGPATRNKLDL